MLSPIYTSQPSGMLSFAWLFWPRGVVTTFCCSSQCLGLQDHRKTVHLEQPINNQELVKVAPASVRKAARANLQKPTSPRGQVHTPVVAAVRQAETSKPQERPNTLAAARKVRQLSVTSCTHVLFDFGDIHIRAIAMRVLIHSCILESLFLEDVVAVDMKVKLVSLQASMLQCSSRLAADAQHHENTRSADLFICSILSAGRSVLKASGVRLQSLACRMHWSSSVPR